MYKVKLSEFVQKMELKNLLPDIDTDSIRIEQSAVNRLALQLAGFFEYFDSERIQVIGNVENAYLEQMGEEKQKEIYEKIFSFNIPCLVFCRGLEPSDLMLDFAEKSGVPLFTTETSTSEFIANSVRWLSEQLAPRISIHGVLVDVYGEGVLIMGESGIGKSEAALELIHRGHRLVSDDVVEIRKISDDTLMGTSPDITRHFIELRGIGIVDVKSLFGVKSVMYNQTIDMVIRLEDWNREANYDRLGLDEDYIEFLGNKVVCYSIPIRPGRNLAVIVESAAINYRAKKMGYNAAQELYNRVTGGLAAKSVEDEKE
ncbi:MAG: HPr(Ser) kinase/phosphatase [Eubacterium sp.]|nr:HPr(Ser) kinase/phosphatase [Eubacterium sp.]MDD7208669.1 HPr(Ser) kinase/phosphatase [Lachnospiraceae bacterium]MDY5497111.1 HPr(Ser) kinase/phosphatase [Anaerobutyricum sp.]